MKTVLLIPSLNPDEKTVQLVQEFLSEGIQEVIIIDDGSRGECKSVFNAIDALPRCTVLTHAVNQGKGRALKTGINYILNIFTDHDLIGVVTADADGQHSPKDVMNVATELTKHPSSMILGTRDFNAGTVPFKSRNGNKITTFIFKLLYGKTIRDTQTGLRAIPYDYLKTCLRLPGERFEYEINMLITAVHDGLSMIEVPIQTIYFDGNRETHFNTVCDSARIYSVILRRFFLFSASGILSFLLDIGLFALLTKVIFFKINIGLSELSLLLGTVLARICSSLFNFYLNKTLVFNNKKNFTSRMILKYYSLCVCQMLMSWLLVTGIYLTFSSLMPDATIIKVLVDLLLFLLSFQIQRQWVFKKDK